MLEIGDGLYCCDMETSGIFFFISAGLYAKEWNFYIAEVQLWLNFSLRLCELLDIGKV